jgi:hypothetical protein
MFILQPKAFKRTKLLVNLFGLGSVKLGSSSIQLLNKLFVKMKLYLRIRKTQQFQYIFEDMNLNDDYDY